MCLVGFKKAMLNKILMCWECRMQEQTWTHNKHLFCVLAFSTTHVSKHILSQTFYGIALSTFASSGYSFYAAIFMLKVLNKWFWQINDVLYFSFDIQANYNILNKIIIYFSTDNCLALPISIVWEGSQKAFEFTGGVYMYKNWVFALAYK